MTFLKLCVNVMNRNIKIQIFFDIVKVSNLDNLIDVFNKKDYLKTFFMCFLYFSKV